MRRFLLTVICLLPLAVPALLDAGDAPDDSAAYESAVQSTLWLTCFDKEAKSASMGTGVLIDAEKGWLLTAYHVIDGKDAVCAFLPMPERAGGLISDPSYYLKHAIRLGEAGPIIARDAKRDLAVIQVRTQPMAKAIPLAAESARPGQKLISIGNSVSVKGEKVSGVLWRYAGGNVRQVYDHNYRFAGGQEITARVVEFTLPLNPGDSGGPILRNGELVAISSGVAQDQNQVHYGIDVSEIRAFLRANRLELSKPAEAKP